MEIKEKLKNLINESIIELQKEIDELQKLRVTVFKNNKRRERVESWITDNKCAIMDYKDELKTLNK
jgi:hypothetical protein